MTLNWETIINDLGVFIASAGAIVGLSRKFPWLLKAATFLEKNAKTIGEDIAKVIDVIDDIPLAKKLLGNVEDKVVTVIGEVRDSQIAKLALIGLHNFQLNAGNLSETQKLALVKFVVESCPVEWNVNEDAVTKVLNEVENAVNEFGNLEIVKAANYFTEAQNKKINTFVAVEPQITQ